MAPVVSLNNLGFRFPDSEDWVFEDLDLAIAPGEFVALVGGSGVGKSTILRIAAGLIAPQTGTVTISEERAKGTRRRALVFQDSRLMPWRTVRANVRLGLEGLGLAAAAIDERIDEVLELTGIAELGERWPHQLSGGQAQRVGIARALAVKPRILLMDEPFSAVDALTRRRLQTELERIWRQSGAAVAFVTHDIEEAIYLSDRIVVLGGSPARIVSELRNPLTRPRSRTSEGVFKLAAKVASLLDAD